MIYLTWILMELNLNWSKMQDTDLQPDCRMKGPGVSTTNMMIRKSGLLVTASNCGHLWQEHTSIQTVRET